MRLLLFVAVAAVALITPWWIFALCALVYAFRYTAYELLLIGVALDVAYGVPTEFLPWPILYTAATALLVVMIELIKPRMSFYERTE